MVYIGQTSHQSLAERWDQFNRSARTGKRSHSGGRTYFATFGATKSSELHLCAFPLSAPGIDHIGTYLLYIESKLLWQYLVAFGRLPICNKG